MLELNYNVLEEKKKFFFFPLFSKNINNGKKIKTKKIKIKNAKFKN